MSLRSRRRVWSWVGLVGIVAGLVALFVLIFRDQKQPGVVLASMLGVVFSSVTALIGMLWKQVRPPVVVESDGVLVKAADDLAATVHQQWVHAAGERRLRYPTPVAVRWRWSRRPVTGSVQDAVDSPQSHERFPVLPGLPVATAESVGTGELRDLVGIYSGLSSGRLVILGGPGTGKTAAAILMLVDNLEYRKNLSEEQRAKVPIPVLLTPHGWNPRHQWLGEWLADRITTDFPFLKSTYGPDTAARLVQDGRVALFLDGFDEMAPHLRQAAVKALNEQATFRLVLLTRPDEFTDAVGTQHLYAAAALELQPVPAVDAADYLTRCQVQPLPQEWQRLIDHVRGQPDSALASALDSPLTLSLVAP